jgi:Arc/MetJ-type ribon-helix-helix transcriptional regulator
MRKTSVYLSDDEAEGLRALARATGRSQAELIREGVRRLLLKSPKRIFHSMAQGASDGPTLARWGSDELAARRLGRSN